ncbi:hypothetical protein CKO09_10130 [Chromatium weissei]|nr:hypothetical protein [Chromatium weissei]
MIYAPLFTGLSELLKAFGFNSITYIIAATVTGTTTAVLYGARELSLISSGIGAVVGVILLILFGEQSAFIPTLVIAASVATAAGLTIHFPTRCSTHVGAKAMSGLIAGALGGSLLILLDLLQTTPVSLFIALAVLVSLNGLLYVLSLRGWVALLQRWCHANYPCYLIETGIMALLATVAAGSVWMVSAPLMDSDSSLWQAASLAMHTQLPQAMLGGLVGGGLAGMALELFRLSWVSDL